MASERLTLERTIAPIYAGRHTTVDRWRRRTQRLGAQLIRRGELLGHIRLRILTK